MSAAKRVTLWGLVAVNIVIILILLTGSPSGGVGPLSCVKTPSPEGTVERFFYALANRDFQTADGMICNYTTLGISQPASGSDALSVYIYENLFDSYSIAPVSAGEDASPSDLSVSAGDASPSDISGADVILPAEEYKVSGSSAEVECVFTGLDRARLSEELTMQLREIGKNAAEQGVAVDNDEMALKLFGRSLDELKKKDVSNFRSSKRIKIQLAYTDEEWKIVLTPELYDVLTGRFAEKDDQAPQAGTAQISASDEPAEVTTPAEGSTDE